MARRAFEFFPRLTTLRGGEYPGRVYVSKHVDVSEGGDVAAFAELAASVGSPIVDWNFQVSSDLQVWTESREGTLDLGSPLQQILLQPAKHLRVRLRVYPEESQATLRFEGVVRKR